MWWGNGLVPLTVYFFLRSEIVSNVEEDGSPPATPEKMRISISAPAISGSKTALAVLTVSGVLAIIAPSGSSATIALGLSYTVFTAFAFLLVGKAGTEAKSGPLNGGGSIIYSANGLLSHPGKALSSPGESQMAVIRDVSAAAALATAIATFTLESFTFGGLAYWGVIGQAMGDKWVLGQSILRFLYGMGMVGVHCGIYWTVLILVSRFGSAPSSCEFGTKAGGRDFACLVPSFADLLNTSETSSTVLTLFTP